MKKTNCAAGCTHFLKSPLNTSGSRQCRLQIQTSEIIAAPSNFSNTPGQQTRQRRRYRQIGTPQSRRHDGAIFHHAEADGILLLPQEAFRAINGIQDPEAAKS